MAAVFYGADQAGIHHERFGALAGGAANDLVEILRAVGIASGTVVDLGCGSGILAAAVGAAGFAVVGVDLSADMVELARTTAPGATFTVGSIHDAELPAGCVGVTAIGEVLNYATDERAGLEAVGRLAERIHHALVPGGVWLFDVSGPGRAGPTGAFKQFHRSDSWCLGMTATEHPEDHRLDREITIFVLEAATGGYRSFATDGTVGEGPYRRIEELHVLRLYDRDELAATLRDVGFEVEVADGYRTPVAHPNALPGWYVVRATKPVAATIS
jgi:SAM-dependent methyltransferase